MGKTLRKSATFLLFFPIFGWCFFVRTSLFSVVKAQECFNQDLGNLNCDSEGEINQEDLNILLSCWTPEGVFNSSECFKADLSYDAPPKVNEGDLAILLKNWGVPGSIDFYGRRVKFIKLFGQPSFGETSPDTVVSNKIFHASGVVVDRSRRPNIVYVVDTGNNRVLGFDSLGVCQNNPQAKCTNDTDCENSHRCIINTRKSADIIFGQSNDYSGACNGDNNLGIYKNPTATTLCLMHFPVVTNTGEYWMRVNFDVDSVGNLYIPDYQNNRILKFNQPFSADKSNGKGDNIADFVWCQDDFNSNGINKGRGPNWRDRSSCWIGFGGGYGFGHVSSRGVSVDSRGNLWVADTFNSRILRFPPNSKNADLVIGQDNFSSNIQACYNNAPLNRLCAPTLVRLHPETGKLYVTDEFDNFNSRLLVFEPPFTNGMMASKVIFANQIGSIEGYPCSGGVYHFQSSGFVFNPFQEGEYARGVLWINEICSHRVLLIDNDGNIIKVIGAPHQNLNGCSFRYYDQCGKNIFADFNLCDPGGTIGFDNAFNIYLADERFHRLARFSLPYNTYQYTNPNDGQSYTCLPNSNGGLFEGTTPNSVSAYKFLGMVGTIPFKNRQLIVKDHYRYLVWDSYLEKGIGSKADFIIGQSSENVREENFLGGWSFHAIDDENRLWAFNTFEKLIVYQLPFRIQNQEPLANNLALYWLDDGKEVEYRGSGIAFDKFDKAIWISDGENNRILRIKNYQNFRGKLYVDMVLGQPNKESKCCNQKPPKPDGTCEWNWVADTPPRADTLCEPRYIRFDNYGNLYVVENKYECHGNNRIVVFMREDIERANGLFPNLAAKKVFVSRSFDEPPGCGRIWRINEPNSPVTLAFNSKNQMVVGNDGYYMNLEERPFKQLWFYRDPLLKDSSGNFIQGQRPDAYINLPMGAAGEIWFDENDNLVIQDHTWPKVWVINLEKDPSWLVPIE